MVAAIPAVFAALLAALAAGNGLAKAEAKAESGSDPAPPPADLERLVDGLSRRDWRDRQRAADALVKTGEVATTRLEQLVRETSDLDVRVSAQLVLNRIDEDRRLGPTKVTLDFDDAPLPTVFEALGRQAGFRLRWRDPRLWDGAPFPKFSVHLHGVSYWDALDALDAKGGAIEGGDEPDEMCLRGPRSGTAVPPTAVRGPFLVRLEEIEWRKRLNTRYSDEIKRELTVGFRIQTEPKVPVLYEEVVGKLEVVGADGQHLQSDPADDGKPSPVTPTGRAAREQSFSLSLSPKSGADPKTITAKGAVRFVVRLKSEPFEVVNPLEALKDAVGGKAGITREVGGVQVTAAYFQRPSTGFYDAILSVDRQGRDDRAWSDLCSALTGSDVRLLDGAGREIQTGTPTRISDDGGGRADFRANLMRLGRGRSDQEPEPPEPAKLVWEIPTQCRAVEVPFEFKLSAP